MDGSLAANNGFSTLKNLAVAREGGRKRASSFDRSGGNSDCIRVPEGETKVLAEIRGAGCITHVWVTMDEYPRKKTQNYLRAVVVRMYWDGETEPSVEVPIGDFFGMGHCMTRNFDSAVLNMSPENGRGFNCYFAMPFATGARIEIVNQHENPVRLFYYIDYEAYERLSDRFLRFHACWRRRNPCRGMEETGLSNEYFQLGGKNTSGKDNYVILDAEGEGHYVGCHLDIHNLRMTRYWNWYGEGDDMIFIDGEGWPPSLHGTGTEDYFNTAWCPTQEVCSPQHGIILAGEDNWSGRITLYRYHVEDPVMFRKSIRVTIEHGHDNHRNDDYSSTAYWYQREPHRRFEALLPVQERMPLPHPIKPDPEEIRKYVEL